LVVLSDGPDGVSDGSRLDAKVDWSVEVGGDQEDIEDAVSEAVSEADGSDIVGPMNVDDGVEAGNDSVGSTEGDPVGSTETVVGTSDG